MLLSLVYLVVRMLLRLLVRDGQGEAAKDLEIVVLRHQLNVLLRQVNLPRFRRSDRAFLAAAARRLPRVRWERFLVTPKTLLHWHRELVRRLAKENPRWGLSVPKTQSAFLTRSFQTGCRRLPPENL